MRLLIAVAGSLHGLAGSFVEGRIGRSQEGLARPRSINSADCIWPHHGQLHRALSAQRFTANLFPGHFAVATLPNVHPGLKPGWTFAWAAFAWAAVGGRSFESSFGQNMASGNPWFAVVAKSHKLKIHRC